jgi:hypothetical protein
VADSPTITAARERLEAVIAYCDQPPTVNSIHLGKATLKIADIRLLLDAASLAQEGVGNGVPLVPDGMPAVQHGEGEPGLGWVISEGAREKIEALIRENTRNASELHSIVLATLPAAPEPPHGE